MLQALALDPVLHAAVYRDKNMPANQKHNSSIPFFLQARPSFVLHAAVSEEVGRTSKAKIFTSCTLRLKLCTIGLLSYDTQPWFREKAVQAQNHTYDESKDKNTLLPLLHELKLKLKHANKHLLFTTFRSLVDPLFFF